MKRICLSLLLGLCARSACCWGFYGHQKINYYAVFLLPPEMMQLFKPQAGYLSEHAVDPDKRRYLLPQEGPRHYIDLDHYGCYPYNSLPRIWKEAETKFGTDSLQAHGIVPWWIQTMLARLTNAFRAKDRGAILKNAAEIGHYIADAHVPLHACSNHNGQFSGQKGIHGFWESRIPELLLEKKWDLFIGKAEYIPDPLQYTWKRVLESGAAADSVLRIEKELSRRYPPDRRYAFESRNGQVIRQYSSEYAMAYDRLMNGMVERRWRLSVYSVASFWYTAWVNAGQPDLSKLSSKELSAEENKEMEELNQAWRRGAIKGREHE